MSGSPWFAAIPLLPATTEKVIVRVASVTFVALVMAAAGSPAAGAAGSPPEAAAGSPVQALAHSALLGRSGSMAEPCDVFNGWVDRALRGSHAFPSVRTPIADYPVPPRGLAPPVSGGVVAMESGTREVVFFIVEREPASVVEGGTDASPQTIRAAWIAHVDACMASRGEQWQREERDAETHLLEPADKALGRFPDEAYIREDDPQDGVFYRHNPSGTEVQSITDRGYLAARAAALGYEGAPIALMLAIVPGAQ